VLPLVILGLFALSRPFMMGGMMGPAAMGDGGWPGGPAGGLGGLTMLAFWGLPIVSVVFLVRLLDRHEARPPTPTSASALDIVRRRCAAGELTREQFEQMRRDLRDDSDR
jgi:putative membrane protein